jgi:adenine C2-methylase RlmN of 23S rRNA A2503 and tRNA A37
MTTIAEKLVSEDGKTIKYIHLDGSENTLKIGLSCSGDQTIDRKKAVIFLSSSVGCLQGCKFCFLTEKGYKYQLLTTQSIINSCIDVIVDSKELIADRYLKISFMGMGDAFLCGIDLYQVVVSVFDYAVKNNIVLGIDGVDIGTSYPRAKSHHREFSQMERMNDVLIKEKYPLNPNNHYIDRTPHENNQRTVVRLFISMPTVDVRTKFLLMPRSEKPTDIYTEIGQLNIDVIFHCLFLDGVNDRPKDIRAIIAFFEEAQYEVRLLRYNRCPGSMFEESWRIDKIIETFKTSNLKFKYQVSVGSEIQAACGQFICKVRE